MPDPRTAQPAHRRVMTLVASVAFLLATAGGLAAAPRVRRKVLEFQFRYNNCSGLGISDWERTANALKGIEGKR